MLALGIALSFLRSSLNLALDDAAAQCAAARRVRDSLARQVESVKVEIERDAALAALGPRAERLGLRPPPPEAVTLLAAAPPDVSTGARPLPGAGVLGRLVMNGATALGGIEAAVAAPEVGGAAAPVAQAVPAALVDPAAHAALAAAGDAGGERGGCQCEFCRRSRARR